MWTQVEVPHGAFQPHLSLLPYTLSDVGKSDSHYQFGMDARYSISPELTSVASINPDFGTVENAVESITFSRSEQYVRETRAFFLEGRSYFGSFNSGNYLFYSNRIQDFDVGAKLYGKLTPLDTVAFLTTASFGVRDDSVMRLQHSFSPTSSASLFFNQMTAGSDNNQVGQLATDSRWGKFSAGGQWVLTGGRDAGGDAKSITFGYGDKHFSHGLEFLDYSRTFRAADGLVPFIDYKGFDGFESYQTDWRHGFWQGFSLNCTTSSNPDVSQRSTGTTAKLWPHRAMMACCFNSLEGSARRTFAQESGAGVSVLLFCRYRSMHQHTCGILSARK